MMRDRCGREGERGSGTVLGLAAIAVVLILFASGAWIGSAIIARHRAQAAADLGALAGADHLRGGRPIVDSRGPCRAAAAVVRGNGAEVRSCQVRGTTITVTVSVPAGLPGLGSARGMAKAGVVAPRG